MKTTWPILAFLLLILGCRSPYYADRGALFGGLTGAGLGAIIGEAASNNPAAGAVIGAGVGSITGAAVGETLDEIDAQNRARIAQQLGRPVRSGAATTQEIVAMTRSGVDEQLIVSYIRNNGVATQLRAADVISLHEQGVSTQVIEAMQSPPQSPPAAVSPPYERIVVEEHYPPPPPYWWYGPRRYRYRHCGPRVGWGISISN